MSNQPPTDPANEPWFQSFKAGDEPRYQEVFDRYYRMVYYYTLKRLGGDYSHLDDIVSNAFTRAWNNRDKITSPKHLRNYLFRVVHDKSVSEHRKTQSFRSNAKHYATLIEETEVDTPLNLERVHAMLIDKLYQALEELPNGDVLKMAYIDGMTTRDIAAKLDTTENNVYIMKSRAIKQLRQRLGNDIPIALLLAALSALSAVPY